MKNQDISRRKFLGTTVLAAAGITLASKSTFGVPAFIENFGKPNSVFNGVQIGVISYSWRSMPSSAEQVLQYCVECGISAIELMGPAAEEFAGIPVMPPVQRPAAAPGQPRPQMSPEQRAEIAAFNKKVADWRANVPMTKFEQLRKMYNKAGVKIFGWKPSAMGTNNTDAEVDYAFRAAKALGANQATLELPRDSAQSKRIGDIAAKNKIYASYHGHLQQTFTLWDEALAQSEYNAMNLDSGHYVEAGGDPIPLIVARHDRIASMHIKDKKSKAHGGGDTFWGEGDAPILQMLQLMAKNKYKFPATIELEYPVPAGSDAVKETIKCLEYVKTAFKA
ncbi:MAG TPA: xylose isomerase [Sphingobacteriaceae bacterium]|nr:xylose isomerase [Sphingobacteriaceae bacterium]